MRIYVVVVVLIAVAASPASAQPAQDPLRAAMDAFFAARGDQDVEAAIAKVMVLMPEPKKVIETIQKHRARDITAVPAWSVMPVATPGGPPLPCYVVPRAPGPGMGDPSPLLVHLIDGGEGTDAPSLEDIKKTSSHWPVDIAGTAPTSAREQGITCVIPLATKGVEWWSEAGAVRLEAILRGLRADYDIAEDKVFLSQMWGYGAGCFAMAMARPTPFAGFITWGSSPEAAAARSGRQFYPVNTGPWAFNMLNFQAGPEYPTARAMPFVAALMRAEASVHFTSHPFAGISGDEIRLEREKLHEWMRSTSRQSDRHRVVWETATPADGRAFWVTILEIGETPVAPEFADLNVARVDEPVKLGFWIDTDHPGPGVRVQAPIEGSLAKTIDLRQGDVITGVDEVDVQSRPDLTRALDLRKRGMPIEVRVVRDGSPLKLTGTIPEFKSGPVFARERPSGRIEVETKENRVEVLLRGVRKYALELSPALFNFDAEIVVTTNGRESFRGKVVPDVGYLLRSFARDRDRTQIYLGRLVIDVPVQ